MGKLHAVGMALCTITFVTHVRADDACRRQEIAPLPGDQSVEVLALNNRGQVLGVSSRSDSHTAFVWQSGQTSLLTGFAGYGFAEGRALNDLGHVAGIASDAPGLVPVLWSWRGLTRLPGQAGDAPTDINNRLQVVGTRGARCLFWPSIASEPIVFGPPGAVQCWPTAINDRGEVVGILRTSASGGFARAFAWSDGVFTEIPPPLDSPSSGLPLEWLLNDINDRGLAVGYAAADFGVVDVFTWSREQGSHTLTGSGMGTGSAVNDWNAIFAYSSALPQRLLQLDPNGNVYDRGTLGGVGEVNYLRLFANERFQIAWESNQSKGYFCQLPR